LVKASNEVGKLKFLIRLSNEGMVTLVEAEVAKRRGEDKGKIMGYDKAIEEELEETRGSSLHSQRNDSSPEPHTPVDRECICVGGKT
jgi:hypothetical protein